MIVAGANATWNSIGGAPASVPTDANVSCL